MKSAIKHNLRGYTLIELIVVIALIAVLAVGAITLLNPISAMQKAMDAKRKSDLGQMKQTLELYYHDYG